MTTNKVRVVFPKNVYGVLSLVQKVVEKHLEEGASSPLSVLPINDLESKRERCLYAQRRAEALRREMEQLMEEKRQLVEELMTGLRASRDILLSIHIQSPRVLGEWGFEVNNPARKAAKKDAATPDETAPDETD